VNMLDFVVTALNMTNNLQMKVEPQRYRYRYGTNIIVLDVAVTLSFEILRLSAGNETLCRDLFFCPAKT